MRRRLLILAASIALLAGVAPVASAATTLASLKGTWGGTHVGTGPQIHVVITLSGGANGSTVKLTGAINCSGRETYTGRTPTMFKYQERILKSTTEDCIGLGWVTLTPRRDGRLAYHWTDGSEHHSRAVLERLVL